EADEGHPHRLGCPHRGQPGVVRPRRLAETRLDVGTQRHRPGRAGRRRLPHHRQRAPEREPARDRPADRQVDQRLRTWFGRRVAPVTAPTILFDIGLDLGGADTALYFHVGNATYGKIGVAKVGPEHLLTDVLSDRLLSFETHRTSSRVAGPVVTYEAGTASLTLLN